MAAAKLSLKVIFINWKSRLTVFTFEFGTNLQCPLFKAFIAEHVVNAPKFDKAFASNDSD